MILTLHFNRIPLAARGKWTQAVQETKEEVTAVVQVGGDRGSDQDDGGGGEVFDSGCVLKVEWPGFSV